MFGLIVSASFITELLDSFLSSIKHNVNIRFSKSDLVHYIKIIFLF